MEIRIRKAIKADCPQLMDLIRELAVFEKAPDEVTVSPQHFENSGFGDQPVWWALVAEDQESKAIVAMALYYVRYSTWKGQRLYLEDLIVSENCRGKGIGKQLFDQLIELAKKEGYSGMVWQALDWNTPALDFYRKYDANLDSGWVNCSLGF